MSNNPGNIPGNIPGKRSVHFNTISPHGKRMAATLGSLLFVMSAFLPATLLAIEDVTPVRSVLKQMAYANRNLSYRGIFTYEHEGVLKTVRVIHAVRDGKEYERLIHLSGPSREIIRRGNPLDCNRAGDTLLRGAVIEASPEHHGHLEDYYNIYIRGEDRIADRAVRVVHLVPRDNYRYGYVLSVDKESGLLLQSLLIDGGNKVLERFQFVDVEVGVLIDDTELSPRQDDHLVATVETVPCLDETAGVVGESRWRTTWTPPGFMFTGYQQSDQGTMETLLFTDGLAVFSVFIDREGASQFPPVQAKRGATVAHLTRKRFLDKNYVICVVGEIPVETAKRVAESLAPAVP